MIDGTADMTADGTEVQQQETPGKLRNHYRREKDQNIKRRSYGRWRGFGRTVLFLPTSH
jgi:hypothetical protein